MLETVEIKAGRVDEETEALEMLVTVMLVIVEAGRLRKAGMVVMIGGG